MSSEHSARRKPMYPVGPALRGYLEDHARWLRLPVVYGDLLRHPVLSKHTTP